ncbi:MAG: polymer-forming cytoskeletal protein [Alphaproteobacteria bacterium]
MSIFGKSDRGESEVERPHPAPIAQPAPSRPTPVPGPSHHAGASASTDMSVVSRGLTIEGNLSGEDDIRIDGSVTGDIKSRTLIVSQGATVNGSVTAEMIELLGHISGELNGKTVRIAGTGQLDGDINYDTLSIEAGAVVNGNLRHRSAKAAASGNLGKGSNGTAKPVDAKPEVKEDDKAAKTSTS